MELVDRLLGYIGTNLILQGFNSALSAWFRASSRSSRLPLSETTAVVSWNTEAFWLSILQSMAQWPFRSRRAFEHLVRSQCCIWLMEFSATEVERTQGFTLRWSDGTGTGTPSKEIVHQQWNFSPYRSTRGIKDYQVSLEKASLLELIINQPAGKIPCRLA
jgi:hypothetical protein